MLFDFTYPLLSSALVYLTLVFSNYISEQAQRRRIRSAFGQYLSPDLVEQLANSPEKLVLGGEEREMSILFSDVRGFTTISELYKNDPQGLTSLMNSFLTPLTNAIIEHNGTIDKYMGDAIMAFWNAPLNDAQHEVNACEAALEMLLRVETLNRQREQQAKETGQRFIPLNVGVGINTGKCVVGNMGSDLRFNYSVLGDPVNLASRLEGQSKNYGVPIIVGSKTAASLRDKFAVLELDCITVKGKTEPESVYTVLGRADVAGSDRFGQLHHDVDGMLAQFRQRDFAGAATTIVRCRKISNGFGLDYFSIFTTSASGRSNKLRHLQIGMASSFWTPNRRDGEASGRSVLAVSAALRSSRRHLAMTVGHDMAKVARKSARRLRSQLWFDNPENPGMTALYLERYLNFGLTRRAAFRQTDRRNCADRLGPVALQSSPP